MAWRSWVPTALAGVCTIACAADPPGLPSNGLGDEGTSTLGGNEGDGDSGSGTATSGIGGNSGSDTSADGTGATETGAADSTTTGPPMGATTGGPMLPWFVGDYEGTWEGSCTISTPIGDRTASAEGTWQVHIDEDGNVEGTYNGDFSGEVTGDMNRSGMTTLVANGEQLDECAWSGTMTLDGGGGTIRSCGADCDGTWEGGPA
jgi:hypothetical protein